MYSNSPRHFLCIITCVLNCAVISTFSIERGHSFHQSSPVPSYKVFSTPRTTTAIYAVEGEDKMGEPKLNSSPETIEAQDSIVKESKTSSLDEKMKSWEASDEEIKAASLGGITPGKVDSFDIGLFIMFPFIVGTSLLFFVFPFIRDSIDVSSVGPPPMV